MALFQIFSTSMEPQVNKQSPLVIKHCLHQTCVLLLVGAGATPAVFQNRSKNIQMQPVLQRLHWQLIQAKPKKVKEKSVQSASPTYPLKFMLKVFLFLKSVCFISFHTYGKLYSLYKCIGYAYQVCMLLFKITKLSCRKD